MQKSIVSQNMVNPSTLPLPNGVQYNVCLHSPVNFLINYFNKPADLFYSTINTNTDENRTHVYDHTEVSLEESF